MLKVTGQYVFNVMGDGVETETLIPLRGLEPPTPIAEDKIPTELIALQVGQSPGGGTCALEDGEYAHLYFDKPPPANNATQVTITALFGIERLE
jgi:hypothetical protein